MQKTKLKYKVSLERQRPAEECKQRLNLAFDILLNNKDDYEKRRKILQNG